jgi:hypothetical protein
MAELTIADLLQAAIKDIKQGNLKAGKAGLARIINAAPDSAYAEKSWIWLSATFADPEQKRVCLENALKINPDNEMAKRGLNRLPPPVELETVKESEEFEDPAWLTEDNMDSELIFPPQPTKKVPSKNNPPQTTLQPPQKSDQQLIDEYIARQTARGWQIISRTDNSAQLRMPKQWSSLLLVLGLILLCLYGAGLIVLLLALVDYLLQKERVVFVTANELRAQTTTITATRTRGPIATVALAVIIIAAVFLAFSFLMSLIVLLIA